MLTRKWVPSPNCSSGGHQGRIVVVHTSEGSTDQDGLAGYLANPSSQVSYQVCFDNSDPGVIVECVSPSYRAWAALDGNSWGVHGCCCTPSGASYGWSTDTWMQHGTMLEKCGLWIAEECARFGIPIQKISHPSSQSGVCGHAEVSNDDGGDHGDPGPNFPWSHVLSIAAGGPVPIPPSPSPAPGGPAPPFPGTTLINFTSGHGTRDWQQQMANRGWGIGVDDLYGNQSESVCRSFQSEATAEGHDTGGVDGMVGPKTWALAWTKPIT
jgi:N-acetyl-anhydromuramyl-L-alanine amidase AmpD